MDDARPGGVGDAPREKGTAPRSPMEPRIASVPASLRVLFLASSLGLLATLALTIADELRPEWTGYFLAVQGRRAAAGTPGADSSPPTRVPQIHVPGLGIADRCIACHAGTKSAELAREPIPLGPHPGPMASLHDTSKVGCTPCHDGQGRATRLPDGHGDAAHWNAPMHRGAMVQATCARCHARERAPRAPALRRGAEIMERYACFGCHQLPGAGERGKVGPDLSFAAARASPAWLFSWLKSPSRMQVAPRMADFSLSDGDAADIVAFLLTFKGSAAIADPGFPPASSSDAQLDALFDRGAKLYRTSRCVSCHASDGVGGTVGPDHSRVGNKLSTAAIAAWLAQPDRFHPGRRMPRFRFTAEERLALAYYLSEEKKAPEASSAIDESSKRIDQLLDSSDPTRGRKKMHALGCLGCHKLSGQEQAQPIGADLTLFGEKAVDRLPFAASWEGPRTREAWTRAKLRDPRAGSKTLIMPSIPLKPEELDALVVATLSYTGRAPKDLWADPALDAPRPRYPSGEAGDLMKDLRCLTCHALNGTGASFAPDLTSEGSRVQLPWLRGFLSEPYEIRPILVMRMPRFYLSKEEEETLAGYLHFAQAREGLPVVATDPSTAARGAGHYARLRCAGCHILGTEGGAVGPNLSDVGRRLQTPWMAFQLLHPSDARAEEPMVVEVAQEAIDLAAFLAGQRAAPPAVAGNPSRGETGNAAAVPGREAGR